MKTYLIAEIAQAHDGSLGLAHSYIDALKTTGVDAIKFQVHIAEAESSMHEPFRIKFSYEDQTRFDYWKRMEFTESQWEGLKQHCEEVGLEFMASPFSLAAVELLERLKVKRYKIGSGEVSNLLMLEKIAKTGKPILLSSGMSSWKELGETILFLKPFGNELTLLQCTTAYPAQPEQWGLQLMAEMKEKFGLPVGYSDHSSTIYAGLAAAALGAEVLEFHAIFDKQSFGPDALSSLTIQEIARLAEGVHQINTSLETTPDKNETAHFSALKVMFGKSLAVNRNLMKGHILSAADLESKKPGDQGIPADAYRDIIGRQLKRDLQQWEFIREEDLI